MSDAERPAFIDPHTHLVTCEICGAELVVGSHPIDGLDVSDEDSYYPDMRPVCGTDDHLGAPVYDGGDERAVRNPTDASEVSGHADHDGFTATRFGAGEVVDIHISCDECGVRYIIEDVPKDKAENPGKYLGDEEGR